MPGESRLAGECQCHISTVSSAVLTWPLLVARKSISVYFASYQSFSLCLHSNPNQMDSECTWRISFRARIKATVRRYLCQIIPHVWGSGVLLASFTLQIQFQSSIAECGRYKMRNGKGKRHTYRTNTSTPFLHTYFLRFRQKCWHSVNFWLLWGLNLRHKQTAGVGVYDNNNEKLLWGPAEKWSRVKLPGLLRSIIVYLISTSLLFASTSQVLSSWQTQQQPHRMGKKGANRD